MKKEDKKGRDIINRLIHPLEDAKFSLKDILQILIGASILAIPVGFTEETWNLGQNLPMINIFGLLALSILFISLFVYYQYHRQYHVKGIGGHWGYFIKRTFSTYVLSFIVVSVLLLLIQKAPFLTDSALAFKRAVIVAFPASMSAVIADTLR